MINNFMFTKLATSFFVDFDKSLLNDLPEILHSYGDAQPDARSAHWMTYSKPTTSSYLEHGQISFTGFTHFFLPKFTNDVFDRLNSVLGNKIPWDKTRLRLIRTRGYVLPHTDEVRHTCINIGLLNSDSAETHFGRTNQQSDFEPPMDTNKFICQDGDVYLLNVKTVHAVYPIRDCDRYLITYPFSRDYTSILNLIKTHHDTLPTTGR